MPSGELLSGDTDYCSKGTMNLFLLSPVFFTAVLKAGDPMLLNPPP